MPFIAAAIIGGVATAASSGIASATAQANAKRANDTNVALARENREVQIDLANTAHQREVADLKAAGLNPILSAGGSGAPVPSTAAGQVDAVPGLSLGDVGGAASSAAAAAQQRELMSENIKLAHEQYLKAAEETEMTARANSLDEAKVHYLSGDDTAGSGQYRSMWDAESVAKSEAAKGLALDNAAKPVNTELLRQQVKKAVQDRAIGASAESRAKIEEQINKGTAGELMIWLERIGLTGTSRIITRQVMHLRLVQRISPRRKRR